MLILQGGEPLELALRERRRRRLWQFSCSGSLLISGPTTNETKVQLLYIVVFREHLEN